MAPELQPQRRNVRRLTPDDAPTVAAIAANSPQSAAWTTESFRNLDRNNQQAWVIECENKILGFLIARILPPDEAEILNLAVTPESRRTGAATNLLQTALTELAEKRIRRIHLEVRESNAAAISFYKKHAFLQSGRRPHYYRDPSEAAVLLVRGLTA